MKLYLNPPSPYARKVVVTGHEAGVADRLDILEVDPWTDPPDLLEATPLAKVPALITDDGNLLVESTTICEYLLDQAGASLAAGGARFEIMSRASIAHGLMDAAFVSVIEKRRPQERRWPDWIDRQYRAITRTLTRIAVPAGGRFDFGDITLACSLAYLDFRVTDLDWRGARPDLGTWLDSVAVRPSMVASKP